VFKTNIAASELYEKKKELSVKEVLSEEKWTKFRLNASAGE